MDPGCPSDDELSAALAGGADAGVAAHVATCARCRGRQEALRVAIALARELPERLPEGGRRDEVRASLLAKAAREPVRVRGPVRWIASYRDWSGVLAGRPRGLTGAGQRNPGNQRGLRRPGTARNPRKEGENRDIT